MSHSPIASQADYADALIVGRRAKNWCFILLLIMLLVQLGVFFTWRYTHALEGSRAQAVLYYLTSLIDFAGMVLAIVLAMSLLMMVKIMLVARTIGISRLTSAYVWCLLLAVLLFPWQSFVLNSPDLSATEFRIPGVLYTWSELVRYGQFEARPISPAILKWARFVGFPLLALVLLLLVQARSSRALRLALGESEADAHDPAPAA